MGRAKQQMMDDEVNDDLVEFLRILSEREELKGALNGIAKQVIAKGADSMSDKQQAVVEKFVEYYKSNNECQRCVNGNVSKLTDYIEIADEGLCPMCQYDKEQQMKD